LRLFLFSSILFLISCSSYKGHNRVDRMNVRFTGGIYKHQKWDDTLTFKRVSFYTGAKLAHDLLITRLDKTSPFYQWMGDQKSTLSDCTEVFVTLMYKDLNNIDKSVPLSYMRDQVEKKGFSEIVIQDFAYQVREHYAFKQWLLNDHKINAYCNRSGIKTKRIHLSMPGFEKVNVLK